MTLWHTDDEMDRCFRDLKQAGKKEEFTLMTLIDPIMNSYRMLNIYIVHLLIYGMIIIYFFQSVDCFSHCINVTIQKM